MTDEEIAGYTAMILGPTSGAAKVLAEAERRRSLGERVEVFDYQNQWVVGPPLAETVAETMRKRS